MTLKKSINCDPPIANKTSIFYRITFRLCPFNCNVIKNCSSFVLITPLGQSVLTEHANDDVFGNTKFIIQYDNNNKNDVHDFFNVFLFMIEKGRTRGTYSRNHRVINGKISHLQIFKESNGFDIFPLRFSCASPFFSLRFLNIQTLR